MNNQAKVRPPKVARPPRGASINETPRERAHRHVVETLTMSLMRDPNIGALLAAPTARGLADTMLRRILRQADVRESLAELVCYYEREAKGA